MRPTDFRPRKDQTVRGVRTTIPVEPKMLTVAILQETPEEAMLLISMAIRGL